MEYSQRSFAVQALTASIERIRISVRGLVQGVGFRPFVYRLAKAMSLSGWVRNSTEGVEIEIEGRECDLDDFVRRLTTEAPPLSRIDNVQKQRLPYFGYSGFCIQNSGHASADSCALILPDVATCDECVREMFDPTNRRYHYPFTNCTNCGPRFSIIEALPYDRCNTTMKVFTMCDECRDEYGDPDNRRFHAQPNACPKCGPHVELWDKRGSTIAEHFDAIIEVCEAVMRGSIIAVKGLGGFQLITDAANDDAVRRLRRLKERNEKPFALMYPNLDLVRDHCELTDEEMQMLKSPESPIVLLRARDRNAGLASSLSKQIAPRSPYLGIMLPYTPLHNLVMSILKCPIIATSGNLIEEPICIDEHDALSRLSDIAELFLVHNRPIARQMDDSIVQFAAGRRMVLRSARGFAPVSVRLEENCGSALALGAHLKNSFAISCGDTLHSSQYIGDLSSRRSHQVLNREIGSLTSILRQSPVHVYCDLHPDYHSTHVAGDMGIEMKQVQHHLAHVLSCMAEHGLLDSVLGIAFDGTGLGTDGTNWGGEFLRLKDGECERVARLRPLPLPGGDAVAEEPRRSALGVLFELFGPERIAQLDLPTMSAFSEVEIGNLVRLLKASLNCPLTSSAGRLFDAVASILGICQHSDFEGQAAMRLQYAAETCNTLDTYEFHFSNQQRPYSLDWGPTVQQIVDDIEGSEDIGIVACKFHNTLVNMILSVAENIGEEKVVLSGGCFQNRLLTELAVSALSAGGFKPYWQQRIPCNDSGIAIGQLYSEVLCGMEQ